MTKKIEDFFVVEGLDGAGKSTLSPFMNRFPGISFVEVPVSEFEREFGNVPEGLDERIDYFMKCNSYYLTKLLPNKINIICRYYPTTVIGNALEFDESIPLIEEKVKRYSLPEPLAVFVLTVDREEQKKRILAKQEITSKDSRVLDDEVYNQRIRNFYLSEAKKNDWMVIDTTNISPEEVALKIADKAREIYGAKHG